MFKSAIRHWIASALMCSAWASASAQGADAWPARPIRMVSPGAPGSGTDLLARLIGDRLGKALKQPIVVDNKPGASGIIATDAVAKATPDGYTLLFSNSGSTVMLQAFEPKLPYSFSRDLAPVAQIGEGGVFLVVAPQLAVNNVRELVALVKASPTPTAYGTWGVGSAAHLLMESIKSQVGVPFNHVPFKSSTQVAQNIIGGQLQVGWVDISTSIPLIRAGKIRPIAISGSHHATVTPHVQTLAEQGFPLNGDGWYALFAPAGTPPEIVGRLNTEVNRILASPEVKEQFLQMNIEDAPRRTPEQFKTKINEDMKLWRSIVVEHGIQPE